MCPDSQSTQPCALQRALAQAAQQYEDGQDALQRSSHGDKSAAAPGNNPLSLVLGYADDEDEDDDDSAIASHGSDINASKDGVAAKRGGTKGSNAQDDPLAGFLSELQSEGLLDGEGAQALESQLGQTAARPADYDANGETGAPHARTLLFCGCAHCSLSELSE